MFDTRTRTLELGIDADDLHRASSDTRTVIASLSSDEPISRYGEVEILSHADGAIDLSRAADGGLPLLVGHDASGIPIGRIDGLHVKNRRLRGTLHFSTSPRGEEAFAAVREGVLRSTSVRLRPLEVEPIMENGQHKGVTITRWQLIEGSLVAVPADPSVGVGRSFLERGQMHENQDEVTRLERERTREIERQATVHQVCDTLKILPESFRRQLMTETALTPAQVRERALDEAARISDSTAGLSASIYTAHEALHGRAYVTDCDGGPATRRAAMAEALCARFSGGELSPAARPYAHMRLRDIARDCLEQSGIRTTYMSDAELIRSGLHSTSDFPIVLGDSIGRAVAREYEAAPAGLKACATERSASDFRPLTTVRLGEAPSLEKVNEGGEFHGGTIGEAGEAYRLLTYGKIFGITRQALINDDLAVFDTIRTAFARAAIEREATLLVDLLVANPTMQTDSVALFHTASHANLANTGGALSDTTLAAARSALRLMKGLDGKTPINAVPRWLIVPAALETAAEKLLADIQPTKSSDVNPFAGKLELIVEPRLDAQSGGTTAWYVASDRVEGLQFAYLEGNRGPVIETQDGFDVDGLRIKCRLDFGAGFVDHRGWYKNPGA